MAMNEPEQTTDDSMVFDLCFGWVAIEDLLMGDEEFAPATAHEEIPLLGD